MNEKDERFREFSVSEIEITTASDPETLAKLRRLVDTRYDAAWKRWIDAYYGPNRR